MFELFQLPTSPISDTTTTVSTGSFLLHELAGLIVSVAWMLLAWRAMRAHERAALPPRQPGSAAPAVGAPRDG